MTHEEPFEHEHADRLTVININYNGSKLLTASIDHKITVYNVDHVTGQKQILEKFTAHDADIRDAKWLHVSTGTQFASIANDLQLRIWAEDPYQAPCSGRRFRRIAQILSGPRVPFVSLDTKTGVDGVTYIAVIDRHGLLSVYEPTQPDEYSDWTLVDQFNVVIPPPSRGEQTSFKLMFDPNPTPLPYVNYVSDEREQLGLAVTAGSEVKIYRSTSNPELLSTEQRNGSGGNTGTGGASHRIMFFEAARFSLPAPTSPSSSTNAGNGPLIRNVAWAPSNVCGADRIAVGGRDGRICIYEVTVAASTAHPNPRAILVVPSDTTSSTSHQNQNHQSHQQQQSTLTTALSSTGTTNTQSGSGTNTSTATTAAITSSLVRSTTYPFPYVHNASLLAVIPDAHSASAQPQNDPSEDTSHAANSPANWAAGGIWNLTFDPSGQLLMSGGADGTSRIWRRSVLGSINAAAGAASLPDDQASGRSRDTKKGREEWLLFAESAVNSLGLNSESDEDDDDDGSGSNVSDEEK